MSFAHIPTQVWMEKAACRKESAATRLVRYQRSGPPRYRRPPLVNLPDRRGDNRSSEPGMMKLQPHPAPHEPGFDHGSTPSRAGYRNRYRLWAELRMSPDQSLVLFHENSRVTMMLRLDEENCSRFQVVQEHSTLNLRLHNIMIDLIAQVGMGPEHLCLRVRAHNLPNRRLHYSPVSLRRKGFSYSLRPFGHLLCLPDLTNAR